MKKIVRLIQKDIEKRLFSEKVIILYGARQVGKTTLVKQIISKYPEKSLYLNCETLAVSQALSTPEPKKLKSYFSGKTLIVLDEAQKIKNVGLILKILVDTYPELQIIATGSSSFELANETSEALTGRAYRFILYPLSLAEIEKEEGRLGVEAGLENLLRFGSYPGVYSLPDTEAINRLNEISSNYLYKDILSFGGLKKPEIITDLLQMLALQIGSEVSYHEIATRLGVSRITVKKYIDLLEKTFVIFKLRAFSRNQRNEISKSVKIYFFDLGLRNSLIQNYNPLKLRNDVGFLWENFLMIERMKKREYERIYANQYFWRTYDQKEIDLVEERGGKLYGYEFKWNTKKTSKAPKDWLKTYKNSNYEVITPENYLGFVT